MSENGLLKNIREQSIRMAEELRQKSTQAKENHEKRVQRAVDICTALETDGGKAIVAFLNDLLNEWDFSPECFIKTKDEIMVFDETFLTSVVGAREAIRSVLSHFEVMQNIVKEEAKKNTAS